MTNAPPMTSPRCLPPLGLVLSIAFLLVVVLSTLAPSWLASSDPLTTDIVQRLKPPTLMHPFGTDNLGRDLYSRVIFGTAQSMKATVIALVLAFCLSSVIGVIAGYVGGLVDDLFMRTMDVLLAVPSLLVSLMLVSTLGFGTINIAIAVGVASVASFARVTRAEVMKVRNMPYVEAARAYGTSWQTICFRHIFPQARGPVTALVAIEFGAAILSISALSFLGYGAAPPAPEWGNLVSEGRNYIATAWWLTAFPGGMIIATVLSASRVGRIFGRITR